jgi:hypothetical protein
LGVATPLPRFERRERGPRERCAVISSGELGGKAEGLLQAREVLGHLDAASFAPLQVDIPALTVVATDAFDAFLDRNRLLDLALDPPSERHLGEAFQRAELPVEIVGDLLELVGRVRVPLAVRSSSRLEDALRHPFAGVYETKMIPNNQPDRESRFRRLTEALKFVWASTFRPGARAYVRAIGRDVREEKMAVLLQEVVDRPHGPRFYPDVSGVARSWSFYAFGGARPEDGVVDLALGLGKTIVDGGRVWTYSPGRPAVGPPHGTAEELLALTQTEMWAVNMGKPPAYDPLAETEYLVQAGLAEAEADLTLDALASTYVAESEAVVPGLSRSGPRVLDFAPLLVQDAFPLNRLLVALLAAFREATGSEVEMEFALTLSPAAPRFELLQVRPMAVSRRPVEIADEEWSGPRRLVASERVMGNGAFEGVRDVVFVKPGTFEARHTRAIAAEVEALNRGLLDEGRPYVLIGFGRWGSSDPWLGIPVDWAQVAGARVMVEARQPGFGVEMSQGAHFFHNLISFDVPYFSVAGGEAGQVHWDRLRALPVRHDGRFVCHVASEEPLPVKVDGRTGRGVVLLPAGAS